MQHQNLRTVIIIQINIILCCFFMNKMLNTTFVLQVYMYILYLLGVTYKGI